MLIYDLQTVMPTLQKWHYTVVKTLDSRQCMTTNWSQEKYREVENQQRCLSQFWFCSEGDLLPSQTLALPITSFYIFIYSYKFFGCLRWPGPDPSPALFYSCPVPDYSIAPLWFRGVLGRINRVYLNCSNVGWFYLYCTEANAEAYPNLTWRGLLRNKIGNVIFST